MNRSRTVLAVLALALAVFLAHGPAIGAGFLRFDDDRIVTDNPLFQAPLPEALAGFLDPTRTIADAYLPVAHLSLWLDWRLLGPGPLGLHLGNLAWHFLACLALLALGRRLGLPPLGACLAALLFAVHPALAEPVAWVSGRKCLLAGLFSFLALCLWLDALSGRRRAGPLAALFTLLAVYSSGAALVLLPWVVLLAAFARRRAPASFPWISLGLIVLVCAGAAAHHAALAVREGTAAAPADRPLALAAGTLGWYARRALLPLGLSSDYPYSVYLRALAAPGLAGLALAPPLAALALWSLRRRMPAFPWAAAATGMLLFTLGLAPFNNLFPASSVLLADRYLYLPLAGLALGFGTLLALPRPAALASGGLLGLVLLLLVPLARERSAQFANDQSLWRAALAAEPASAVARFNLVTDTLHRKGRAALEGDEGRRVREELGRALAAAARPQLRARILAQMAVVRSWSGDPAGAARQLEAAMEELGRIPEGPAVLRAWGRLALDRLRHLQEAGLAEEAAGQAASIRAALPRWPEGAVGLASLEVVRVEALLRAGEGARAEKLAAEVKASLERILADARPSFGALWALARLEATRLAGGSFTRALALLRQARELDPGRVETYIEMANLFQQLEPPQLAGAMQELDLGLRRRPADPDLLLRKGLLLVQQDRLEAGLAWLEKAHEDHPGREDLRDALRTTLILGLEDALKDRARNDPTAWLRRLQALDRFHPEVLRATGLTLAAAGKLAEAVDFLERALAQGARPEETRAALVDASKKLGYQHLIARREEALDHFHRAASLAPGDPELETIREILDGEVRKLWSRARALLAEEKPSEAARLLARAARLALPEAQPAAVLVLDLDQARLAGAPAAETLEASLLPRGREVLLAELAGAPEPAVVTARVDAWLHAGQSSRALWSLELLTRLEAPHPAWPRLQARAHLARGESAMGREILRKALERWPGNPELEEDLGRLTCQEALARWQAVPSEEALDRLAAGAGLCRRLFTGERLDPLLSQVDTVLRNQALAALEEADRTREQGEWARAAELYERGSRLLPPGVEPEFRFQARRLRALCWRGLGQPLRALEELELLDAEARHACIPFPGAVSARAALLFTLDRPAEAREVLSSWLAAFPEAAGREEVEALLPGRKP